MHGKQVLRLTLLVVVAMALILPAAPPALAVGCTGIGCNGRDPQAMGCSADGRTLEDITVYGARIELRYSNACQAAWARTTIATAFCCYAEVTELRAYGARGVILRRYREGWPWPTGSNWTVMAGNNTTVKGYKACAVEVFTYEQINTCPLHAA